MEELLNAPSTFFAPYSSYFDSDWKSKPFIYEYMMPLIILFILGRYSFIYIMQFPLISLRNIFKSLEKEKEKDVLLSLYYVLCLVASVSLGEYATSQEIWRVDYYYCYRGWPENQVHTYELKFYYTFCVSFYLYSIVMLFFEEKKKDFIAMILHHIFTITTVYLAGAIQHYRIGIVIMLLFDACDIALEIAKIFSKCKEDFIATCSFAVFFLLWIRNRLYIFPIYIVPSIFNAQILSEHEIPLHKLHVFIIIVILALQIYWTYFIMRKLTNLMKVGMKSGDPREEK